MGPPRGLLSLQSWVETPTTFGGSSSRGFVSINLHRCGLRCRGSHPIASSNTSEPQPERGRPVAGSNRENARATPFAEFDVFNLESGPLNERFDLVICSEVIEHLADWRPGVRHLASMVKDGGHLLLTCPTGRIHETESQFGHVEHPRPDELLSTADEVGLVPVRFQNWGFPAYRGLKWVTNLRSEWAMNRSPLVAIQSASG